MISTVLIISIIIVFIIIGVWRGAARTLLNFAALVANTIISNFLSGLIARAVYDAFIKAKVVSNLEGMISGSGEQFAANNSIQALPSGAKNMIGFFTGIFGVTPEQLQGRLVPSSELTRGVAQSIEKPVGELTVSVLSVLLMIVIFVVLAIMFKFLIRHTLRIFELPVIRQVNKLLGGVFGLLEGIVLAFVLVNILYVLLSFINPSLLDNAAFAGGLFNALNLFNH